jgi:hypothetical protein
MDQRQHRHHPRSAPRPCGPRRLDLRRGCRLHLGGAPYLFRSASALRPAPRCSAPRRSAPRRSAPCFTGTIDLHRRRSHHPSHRIASYCVASHRDSPPRFGFSGTVAVRGDGSTTQPPPAPRRSAPLRSAPRRFAAPRSGFTGTTAVRGNGPTTLRSAPLPRACASRRAAALRIGFTGATAVRGGGTTMLYPTSPRSAAHRYAPRRSARPRSASLRNAFLWDHRPSSAVVPPLTAPLRNAPLRAAARRTALHRSAAQRNGFFVHHHQGGNT